MNKKLYRYRNIGFTFGQLGRKWSFTNDKGKGKKTLITDCPGGVETARKVAVQVHASLKRSGELRDGLANSAINRLTHSNLV